MNIYIYGNQSFKKEILETLEHSNIKFKLDTDTSIKEINKLSELKQTIRTYPKEIYLIDDEKIIKKNSLNKKLKFFIPKDGIEEEFLLDNGIADLSIDSLKEIPKYIIRKYEEQKDLEENDKNVSLENEDGIEGKNKSIELDEELAQLLVKEPIPEEKNIIESKEENLDDLFDTMGSGVNLDELENLIGKNEENNVNIFDNESDKNLDFNDNFGLNNISFDYDDKDILSEQEEPLNDEDILANLLDENIEDEEDSIEEVFEDVDFLEEIFAKKDKDENEKADDFENFVEEKDEDLDDINFFEEKKTELKDIEPLKGEKMSDDEFFELDSLNEKDLLEALNCTDTNESKSEKIEFKQEIVKNNSETLNISSSNVDDLSLLISKLLNNKTLEITIKIKD
ncbi:hypothetical protein [Arcobacter defluvii]|uniref:Uncharacterized protein n=1 Tax=Arcobacter defluvii TaxID=873191 RepID=A0AAE7BEU2_9BACT|nr:hypothetical protein [Arcobacter defluvii]QKF76412.1 hypothetical protein ADFLV_0352 [Arcobacter defluvii]RXI34562.1 hypothetical protein CP964_00245 [Arcobacter defluvii]